MLIKTSFYKKNLNLLIGLLFILNTSFVFANNNINNSDNLSGHSYLNLINNFDELSLIYENKGKGNYIIKSYSKEENKNDFIKYQYFIENFFSKNNKALDLVYLFRIININFYIDETYHNQSYSNIEDKEIRSCYINILINKNEKNLILNDEEKNFNLILTHELAHCLLGKNSFNAEQFWKYKINAKQQKLLNSIIIKNTKLNIKIVNGKTFYTGPLPIVVYHEIFADVFSSLLLYYSDMLSIDDIKQLKEKRIKDYNNLGSNPKSSYISFDALDNLMEILNSNKDMKLDIHGIQELSELITQKYFIEYLLKQV